VYGPVRPEDAGANWVINEIARRADQNASPGHLGWPATEWFHDTWFNPPMNEYTVHQTHARVSYVWGYLGSMSGNSAPALPNDSTFRSIDSDYLFETSQSVRFRFNRSIEFSSVSPNDLSLINLTTGQTIPASDFTVSLTADNELAWQHAGNSLPNGNYRATIAAGALADAGGRPLAAATQVEFHVLAGDANRDRSTGFADLLIISQNYGLTGKTFSQGNVDYSPDGLVGFNDLLVLTQQYGNAVLNTQVPMFKARVVGDVIEDEDHARSIV
jgi:hypothetical protein